MAPDSAAAPWGGRGGAVGGRHWAQRGMRHAHCTAARFAQAAARHTGGAAALPDAGGSASRGRDLSGCAPRRCRAGPLRTLGRLRRRCGWARGREGGDACAGGLAMAPLADNCSLRLQPCLSDTLAAPAAAHPPTHPSASMRGTALTPRQLCAPFAEGRKERSVPGSEWSPLITQPRAPGEWHSVASCEANRQPAGRHG